MKKAYNLRGADAAAELGAHWLVDKLIDKRSERPADRIAVARFLGDGTRQRTRIFSELQSRYLFAGEHPGARTRRLRLH